MGLDDGRVHAVSAAAGHRCDRARRSAAAVRAPSTWSARRRSRRPAKPQAQPLEPKPHCVQSFTYTFACERRPAGERHVIARARKVRALPATRSPTACASRSTAARSTARKAAGCNTACTSSCPGTKGGLWTYRRLVEKAEPDDVQLAGQRLPRPQHPRLPAARSGARAAGCEAREPGLPLLAADRAGRARAAAAAGRHGHRRRPVEASRTSASHGASRRAKTIVEQEVSARYQEGRARRAVRRFGRRRLVPDRHPSLGPGRRRRELRAPSRSRFRSAR